ncbi:MAG: WYL domain-containing protein [Sulfuritalea sp.]|nr:WYL domain-containing protein [Sulfuritalea sp.]
MASNTCATCCQRRWSIGFNLLPRPPERLDVEPTPHRGRSWLDKVRSVPPTQPLLSPRIDAAVQDVISEALLYEKQVSIRYRKREEKTTVDYRIHPLALIQRGPMLYLYCRIFDYEDARTLAINRIQSAELLLDDRAIYPKDFSIDRQADLGTWGFGAGEKIKVELIFQAGYGDHLFETPLSTGSSNRSAARRRAVRYGDGGGYTAVEVVALGIRGRGRSSKAGDAP